MKWCTAVFLVGLVVLCHTGKYIIAVYMSLCALVGIFGSVRYTFKKNSFKFIMVWYGPSLFSFLFSLILKKLRCLLLFEQAVVHQLAMVTTKTVTYYLHNKRKCLKV